MNIVQLANELQSNFPRNNLEGKEKLLKFSSVTLKKFVTIIIYGENQDPYGSDPFPQEFENPFFYTTYFSKEQCINIILNAGEECFKQCFDKLFLAAVRVDFDLKSFDSYAWLELMHKLIMEKSNQEYSDAWWN